MTMRSLVTMLCLTGVAGAQDWTVPKEGVGAMLVLERSDRTYTLSPSDKPWKGATGRARVRLPLNRAERQGLEQGKELIETGKLDEAAAKIRALVVTNPANYDAWHLRALLLHRQGKHEEALAALRESLIGNRRNPEAWKLLEQVGKAAGRRVERPQFKLRAWMRKKGKGVEISNWQRDDWDFPWIYYGCARAYFRYEGGFKRAFPKRAGYVFTFREQLFCLGAAMEGARMAMKEREKIPADLKLLLDLEKKKTLVPFAFFAIHPDPVPRKPERGFDRLKPRLEAYFDRHICPKR